MLELKKYLNDDVINVIKSFIIFQPQTRKELRLKNNLEKIKEIKNLLYYIQNPKVINDLDLDQFFDLFSNAHYLAMILV